MFVAAAMVPAGSAAAAEAKAAGPSEQCGEQDLFAIEYVSPRDGTTAVYVRPIASHGGCASSWAHNDGTLSGSALAAQCKRIEQRLVEVFGLPEAYPHSFYGKFPANNRADCIDVMRGLSTGRLDSGLPTPFPF